MKEEKGNKGGKRQQEESRDRVRDKHRGWAMLVIVIQIDAGAGNRQ